MDDEGKYQKKSTKGQYRTGFGGLLARTRTLAWILILPAAATVTTDVWFPPMDVFGYDVLLAVLNVTGAFLDGFFYAWETGTAVPSGPKTQALRLIGGKIRSLFLSTYTSWAGMVGFAAAFAHTNASISSGVIYMLVCIICAFVAHGMGRDAAKFMSAREANISYNSTSKAETLVERIILILILYIGFSYVTLGNDRDDVEAMYEGFVFYETPKNRIFVSIIFSILGAYSGNVIGGTVDNVLKNPSIPMGNLVCNAIFAMFGLTLKALQLSEASWASSLILQSFSNNFCGAASAFAGHACDNRVLYSKKQGTVRALINLALNIFFALMVFWVALKIEVLLEGAKGGTVGEPEVESN